MAALCDGVFDRAIHPLHLATGTRIVRLGEPVLDAIGFAGHVEAALVREDRAAVSRLLRELNAIVGQDRVKLVGDHDQDLLQELARGSAGGLVTEPSNGKLRHAVDGDE